MAERLLLRESEVPPVVLSAARPARQIETVKSERPRQRVQARKK
jgi:hypothetical protein